MKSLKLKVKIASGNRGLALGVSRIRELNALAKPSTINLGLGKPSVDMPAEIRALLGPDWARESMEYSDNAGIPELREQLARRYGFQKEELWIAPGAQGATTAALIAMLNPGDEVLCPNPGFLAYDKAAAMVQARPVFYRLKQKGSDFHFDIGEILKKVSSRTRVVMVGSPNNPTGSILSDENYQELAHELRRKKIWILSDEVYGELHYRKDYRAAATLSERIVSVNSFSKSLALTGWRIGWMATQDEVLTKKAIVAHQYVSTCSSVPAQRLLLKVLAKAGVYESVRDGFRREYASKSALFFAALSEKAKIGLTLPEAGFFLFMPTPANMDGDSFAKKLLEKDNVLVMPGSIFGSLGKKFVRVSLATTEDDLLKAAKVINKYYK